MKYFEKISTAIRARIYEFRQTFFQQHNITVVEKESLHCATVIQQLRREYAEIKAESLCWQRNSSLLQQSIFQQEKARVAALKLNQDDLAKTIATSLAEKKGLLQKYLNTCASLQTCQLQQKQLLVGLIKKIQSHRLELRLIKTINSRQQAVHLIVESSQHGSNSHNLAVALQAIKHKQDKIFDQIVAMEILEHELLSNSATLNDSNDNSS